MCRYLALALLFAACGAPSQVEVIGGSLTVSGVVYDFETNLALTTGTTVSTSALDPKPKITIEGGSFVLDRVPENSSFQILASRNPTHRATYNSAVTVVTEDLDSVEAFTVPETMLTAIASGFAVTPSDAKGLLFLQLVDAAGNPKAGVSQSNIVLANAAGAYGPNFLDADLMPDPAASATSASGWVVFFDVPAGVVSLGTPATATATLAMPSSPIEAATVTLANVVVSDGAPPPGPTNVSFSETVFPIFSARGCVACHSGGGVGKDLGGLMLDSGVNAVYRELTIENPLRAHSVMPETSLVLTMPSAESPPDGHPNVTFAGPQDPDYQKILAWLREGAKQN